MTCITIQSVLSLSTIHSQGGSEWTKGPSRGVLSTFLYLVFINDLIDELELTNNTGILRINSSSPVLADDLSCIAVSPLALQSMLNVAYTYAIKWRFSFNAEKSCIVKFRAKGNRLPDDFKWYIGPYEIPCEENYNHLGILINHKCKLSDRIHAACNKGRKSYFALSDLGTTFFKSVDFHTPVQNCCFTICSLRMRTLVKSHARGHTASQYIPTLCL